MRLCGRWKIAVLVVSLAALFFPTATLAQQTRIPPAAELTASDCTPELFAAVDRDYRTRPFWNSGYRAEEYIRKMLEVCVSGSADQILQGRLETLEEERAEHSLYIGKFYLGQAERGKSGLKGARSRFLCIIENYPRYSRIDEVLLLLCRTYELENDPAYYSETTERLQLLMKQFPSSPSRGAIETVIQELKTKELVEKIKEGM